jgi:hypothetical protein
LFQVRVIQALLAYECKKRPDLAAIVARIDILPDEAIGNLPVALPWMREALRDLKRQSAYKRLETLVNEHALDGHTPDPVGTLRRWTGGEAYVRVGRTKLLMTTGALFWLDRQGIWFDTIVTATIDPLIKDNSTLVGKCTRSEYIRLVHDQRNTVSQPTARATYSFFRPG